MPVCGLGLEDGCKSIVFGGLGTAQFTFQSRDVDVKNGTLEINQARGEFPEKAQFCTGDDTVIKLYNKRIFAIDCSGKQMHIFNQVSCLWSSQTFDSLGVPQP